MGILFFGFCGSLWFFVECGGCGLPAGDASEILLGVTAEGFRWNVSLGIGTDQKGHYGGPQDEGKQGVLPGS